MESWERTERLIGPERVATLAQSAVAIFGIGGVGGYTAEALARCGIGRFLLVDADTVSESNLNRQIIATRDTVGRAKTIVMKERILSINPDAVVETAEIFYLPENRDSISLKGIDYIVDAVDTVSAKLDIICRAKEEGIPVISCMGAGNKLDPTGFRVTDIYQTSVCPLAKVMRHELRKRGVESCKVVYSVEEARKPAEPAENAENGRRTAPGSIAFVPSVAGLIAAGEVVRELTGLM